MENFFSKLERYALNSKKRSQENFVSEVFAYLLNENKLLHKRFLDYISSNLKAKEKSSFLKKFRRVKINTQVIDGNNIIDIQITSQDGKNKIVIENKIQSGENFYDIGKETINQIQKYLDSNMGFVAFITLMGAKQPEITRNKNMYLGQFYWQDIYKIFNNIKNKKIYLVDFLKYMEENNMIPVKPFTKDEIKNASAGYGFVNKARLFVETQEDEMKEELRKHFGRIKKSGNVGEHTYRNNTKYFLCWVLPERWKKQMHFSFGIIVKDNKPWLMVELDIDKVDIIKYLESDPIIQKKIKILERMGWEKDMEDPMHSWAYIRYFNLKPNKDFNILGKEMIKNINQSIKELNSKKIGLIRILEKRI